MGYINVLIKGIPYAKSKLRGDRQAPARLSKVIVEQTGALPRVKEACVVKVTFLLPPDKFPADYPYGPDLDNLLKRLLDALNKTVFSEAKGADSCVVSMTVLKARVESVDQAGAHLEILPVNLTK